LHSAIIFSLLGLMWGYIIGRKRPLHKAHKWAWWQLNFADNWPEGWLAFRAKGLLVLALVPSQSIPALGAVVRKRLSSSRVKP
jgi:membrane protein YqaA with SNARE-associated domain